MTYTRTKYLLIIFLMLYALIGVSAHITSNAQEDTYPFFSWFLFVTVPARTQTGFDFMITSVNGEHFDSPVSLLSRPDLFSSGDLSAQRISELAQRLGQALRDNRQDTAAAARTALESHFTTPHTTYLVREFTYSPIEYFKTGATASTSVLATLTAGVY